MSDFSRIYVVAKCPKTGQYRIFEAETTFVGDHIVNFKPDASHGDAFKHRSCIGRSVASFSPAEAIRNFIFWADLEISRAHDLEKALPDISALCHTTH